LALNNITLRLIQEKLHILETTKNYFVRVK